MRRNLTAILLALAIASSAFGESSPVTDPSVSSLCRTYPGGELLATKVSDLLTGEPKLAGDIARTSRSCNCDHAAAIALGVSQAADRLQKASPNAVRPMYESLTASCAPANCQRPEMRKPEPPASAEGAAADQKLRPQRCVRTDEPLRARPRRKADELKVREAAGGDCFCALVASLATQAFAQGESGERIGFFPDEGGFSGGGITTTGEPVTQN